MQCSEIDETHVYFREQCKVLHELTKDLRVPPARHVVTPAGLANGDRDPHKARLAPAKCEVPPSSTARTERPSKATKTPPVPTPPRLALAVAASDPLLHSSLLLLLCYSIYSSRCPRRRRRRRLDASEEEEKERPAG
jgi:hypothetical protein